MITVIVYGQKNPAFSRFLCKALSLAGRVGFIGEDKMSHCTRADFLLVEKETDLTVTGDRLFVVFGGRCGGTLRVGGQITAIVESSNEEALSMLRPISQMTVSCSMSAHDTISIASITEESAVVSLLREMTDINGRVIEPHDMTLRLSRKTDGYSLCAAYALLLLSGYEVTGEDVF